MAGCSAPRPCGCSGPRSGSASGQATNYGIGWFVGHRPGGAPAGDFHSGGSVGGTAYLLIYPDQDLILSLLVNSDFTFVDAGPTIAEMFLAAVPGRR